MIDVYTKVLLAFAALTGAVGVFSLGVFHGQRGRDQWVAPFALLKDRITARGVMLAVALPLFWSVLFCGFVGHVWVSLGRWPEFGEHLDGFFLIAHGRLVGSLGFALFLSIFVVPMFMLVGLNYPRFWYVSFYSMCYGGAVGLAWGVLNAVPGDFLGWAID